MPRIQAGRPDEAVTAAIGSLTAVIDKQPGAFPPARPPAQSSPSSRLQSIFWGFVGLVFVALLVTNPRLALLFLTTILARGGRGGGYSYGGGGFGGAGGRSGGGGASGSW